jgi:bifunctional UDP-N-acetylglucosamine pyrophosphorylase/glucosamine-1-phosphate N-acetyltransferase
MALRLGRVNGDMSGTAVVILGAGMGTRMKSDLPKVLHRVASQSLLGHVLSAAKSIAPKHIVVVHGPGQDAVKSETIRLAPEARFAEQRERRGTGHAVMMAEEALSDFTGTVIVLYGDAPLIQPQALQDLLALKNAGMRTVVLGFKAANPFGYGRLILHGEKLVAIREQKDASKAERALDLCNSGVIAIGSHHLWPMLHKLSPANVQGELYLTDVVELMHKAGHSCAVALCPEEDTMGVNDRVQLAAVEAEFQKRLRLKAMLNGATLIDPPTVHFSADTDVGRDVIIEPNVFFGENVSIADDVHILANSHIEGAKIGRGARIGPFARLRPGADIGENAHIGNYVEIKNSEIGKGAKVNHLSYIGDAAVGAGSNIGAGTITCNYDGFEKHLTEIGDNVFVGSNSALVAPVKIGAGANLAAGTVVAENVPADALAIARPPLIIKEGWAKRYRVAKQARKLQSKPKK